MRIARFAAATSVLAVILVTPFQAAAASPPDPILRSIAGQITHGWTEDNQPLSQLEARWRAGERLYIGCGTTVKLSQRILSQSGIRSRLVGTLTREPFNGFDDGHTLLEVRKQGRWVVYDLDNNRQPVDEAGRGMRLVDFVRMRPRRWRMLANDQVVDLTSSSYPEYSRWVYSNLDRWYDRALGVPLIYSKETDLFVFHDLDRARVQGYSSAYHWVPARVWRRVVGPS